MAYRGGGGWPRPSGTRLRRPGVSSTGGRVPIEMLTDLGATGWVAVVVATFIVGLSKAGFGTGAGLLSVPLMTLALGPQAMLGLMLPVLIAGDVFSLIHYPGQCDRRNLAMLVPGLLAGVAVGWLALGWFMGLRNGKLWMEMAIGFLCMVFVGVQVHCWRLQARAGSSGRAYRPRPWHGVNLGWCAGLTSTLSHAGGPIVALFLLPQQLGRRAFVGTVVTYFFVGNMAKLVPYVQKGLLTWPTLRLALVLLPCVVAGTLIGVYLNRRFTDRLFRVVIYCLAFVTGAALLFGAGGDSGGERKPFGSMTAGLRAYEAGDYALAAREFQLAAQSRAPWRGRALFNSGLSLYMDGQYAEAEEVLVEAARSEDVYVRLRAEFNRGNIAYRLERLEDAEAAYARAAMGCRAVLARPGEPLPDDVADDLRTVMQRADANRALVLTRLRTGDQDAGTGDGATGQARADGQENSGADGSVQEAERTAAAALASGYTGGRDPGTRSVKDILEGVGSRDTGPVLGDGGGERRPGGKDW